MYASTTSAAMVGVEPSPVRVEAHVGGGGAGFSVVGLPDTAVREARDRVRAALAASGFGVPGRRVTVNLAPADLPKVGSAFDLPIALGVLAAARLVEPSAADVVAVGELALDGSVRPSRGALAAAMIASRLGRPCLVPASEAAGIASVPGADIRPIDSLAHAVVAARGEAVSPPTVPPPPAEDCPDLGDVRGHRVARRALEIAAAGGHHLLLSGPPGSGKTMLARRLPGILPRPSPQERLETACVWSALGLPAPPGRPFRAPHHTASTAALVGGGHGYPQPGEVSLAHHGVLFLDELGEFPASSLDALRQPLEESRVVVARRGGTATFPASVQLVAATNPCPCGWRGDRIRSCRCGEAEFRRYRRKFSGPLLDRIDLRVRVDRPDPDLVLGDRGESSVSVAARVEAARSRSVERGGLNRSLTHDDLDVLPVTDGASGLLATLVRDGTVTARGYDRIRRLARTIADLAGAGRVDEPQVAEAMAFRGSW